MEKRAKRASAVGVFLACVLLLAGGSARAAPVDGTPDTPDAAVALNPSESSCLGESLGAACVSSTATAGGTCLAGCCCHYVMDPEGASTCAPCLACSDTSSEDPAFAPGACSDAGALASSDDSGAVAVAPIADAGPLTPFPAPTPTSMPSTGGCVSARDEGVTPSMALLALTACATFLLRRRARWIVR